MSWFRTMRERFMPFPDFYTVLDVETTGLTPGKDLVTQVGFCVVEDRKDVADGSTLLDWTRCRDVDQDWLRWRMAETKRQMEAKGKHCHMTYERLRHEGCDPLRVLETFAGLLSEAKARGDNYLGHNAWGFDIPMLNAHFSRWGPKFEFDASLVIDTGVMEKASQLNIFPRAGEALRDFFVRVHKRRTPGVFWSLDQFCVPKYELATVHGLDMSMAHDAGFDCVLTHLLFETYRELAGEPAGVIVGSEPVPANT